MKHNPSFVHTGIEMCITFTESQLFFPFSWCLCIKLLFITTRFTAGAPCGCQEICDATEKPCMDCSRCSDSCEPVHVYTHVAYTRGFARMCLRKWACFCNHFQSGGCRACGCHYPSPFSITRTLSKTHCGVCTCTCQTKGSWEWRLQSPQPYIIAFI